MPFYPKFIFLVSSLLSFKRRQLAPWCNVNGLFLFTGTSFNKCKLFLQIFWVHSNTSAHYACVCVSVHPFHIYSRLLYMTIYHNLYDKEHWLYGRLWLKIIVSAIHFCNNLIVKIYQYLYLCEWLANETCIHVWLLLMGFTRFDYFFTVHILGAFNWHICTLRLPAVFLYIRNADV